MSGKYLGKLSFKTVQMRFYFWVGLRSYLREFFPSKFDLFMTSIKNVRYICCRLVEL